MKSQNIPLPSQKRETSSKIEAGVWEMNFRKSDMAHGILYTIMYLNDTLRRLDKPNLSEGLKKDLEQEKSTMLKKLESYIESLHYFTGVEWHFQRTGEYYGLCTENEDDWMFKIETGGKDEDA